MSISRGMDKENVVHIYIIEYQSTIKRSKIVPFEEMWMDLETVIQCKASQKEKTNIVY